MSHIGSQVSGAKSARTRMGKGLEAHEGASRTVLNVDKPKAQATLATAGARKKLTLSAKTAGRVLQVSATGLTQSGGGLRGEVSGSWSKESRNRMVKTAEAIDWASVGQCYFVTLTYPIMPESGNESKKHFKRWQDRWRRKFGAPVGMWKLEFQIRGVPHYHLILKAPEGFTLRQVQLWVSKSWFEVVGSGDKKHLKAGTECKPWTHGSPGGYFVKYGTARVKEYQNHAPEGWWTGRWWGVLGGLKPQWQEVELTQDEFFRLKRIARRLYASRGNKRRDRRAFQGLWIRGDNLARAVEFVRSQGDSWGPRIDVG